MVTCDVQKRQRGDVVKGFALCRLLQFAASAEERDLMSYLP